MTLPEVAETWRQAGVSVVPIIAKNRPAVRWKEFQARCPSLDEVHDWWGNGHPYGIAIICGSVSGGLEMTELEADATSSQTLTDIANAADSLGCGECWETVHQGYTQLSPSGGLHMVYRISDHEVPGNEKIAHKAERSPEGQLEVLAETRGEGGYFVGAPSPGSCHPSGEPWLLASGEYGVVPTITWEQRCLIHQAIRMALQPTTHEPAASYQSSSTTLAVAAPVTPLPPLARSPGAAPISPGDDFALRVDWSSILTDAGWTFHSDAGGGERLWCRPGKRWADGHSASTDYNGKSGLYVWSTSAGLPTEEPLSKLFVYANYSFNGDMKAAAQELYRQGYGSRIPIMSMTDLELGEIDPAQPVVADPPTRFKFDDVGNGMRLWKHVKGRFTFVFEQKQVYQFNGKSWVPDNTGALVREWIKVTELMDEEARREGNKALEKWVSASRSITRVNAAISMMRSMPEATISLSDMDTDLDRINVGNGEYNVQTRELEKHSASHLMTRIINANYNPQATAPKWTEFLEQVLPDETVRRYVQRAVGYSLLGKVDQRAFFLIHGPSGTGKSQFLSTLEYVFKDYGATAAEGTFRARETGLTNDLHGLRGKRLVTTSETAESTNFNEALLKRLTGRDQIVSRELYQQNVTWTPECAIWIATNHPPRFNSDDDAIWKRAKLVPFLTRFGTDAPEVSDYARKFLYAEADGILNWIIAGLHDYLENGLGEPTAVMEAATKHREQSDSVIRFLEDQIADNVIIEEPTGQIRTRELFLLYEEWCKSSGERGLGSRRFMNRLESTGRATYTRTSTHSVWRGLHRPGAMLAGAKWHGETEN